MIAFLRETTTVGVQAGTQGASVVDVAQIASAIGTLVLACAVWFQVRAAREQVAAARATVEEMRESRLAQERPQVIVDADYSQPSYIYIVVRNIGRGAAKDVKFDFSADLVSSLSAKANAVVAPLNKQVLFKKGIDFLAPGAEIFFFWDSAPGLLPLLRQRGLEEGITITSKYKSLTEEAHESKWTVNPLLIGDRLYLAEDDATKAIAEATKNIAAGLNQVVSPVQGEIQVSTDIERQQRKQLLGQIRDFLKEKQRNAGVDEFSEVSVNRSEIEAISQYPHTAPELLELYTGIYWIGDYDYDTETGEWTSFRLAAVQRH